MEIHGIKCPLFYNEASWNAGGHCATIESHGTKSDLLQKGTSWNPGDHCYTVESHGSKCLLFHVAASESTGDRCALKDLFCTIKRLSLAPAWALCVTADAHPQLAPERGRSTRKERPTAETESLQNQGAAQGIRSQQQTQAEDPGSSPRQQIPTADRGLRQTQTP